MRNYGARLDTGYRFGNAGFFVEPQATIEYVYTDIDDFVVPGTRARVTDGRTVRGRLGARAGTTMSFGGMRVEPSIMGSAWRLLKDDGAITFESGGQTLRLLDDRDRTYGEVSGILNMFGEGNGASGFLKADYRFGDDLKGYGLKAGFRLPL